MKKQSSKSKSFRAVFYKILKYAAISLTILFIMASLYFSYYSDNLKKDLVFNKDPLYFTNSDQIEPQAAVRYEDLPPYVGQTTASAIDFFFFKRPAAKTSDCITYPLKIIFHGLRLDGTSLPSFVLKQRPNYYYKINLLKRHLDNCILTAYLESLLSKEEIVELYLNEAYFITEKPGITAAAEKLFKKSPQELSLAESAIIAGLAEAPGFLDPFEETERPQGEEIWRIRANQVLKLMLAHEYISQTEFDQADKELAEITFIGKIESAIDPVDSEE